MAMVDADWSIDRATGNIRYIGDDHDGAAPSYATVIQFHRWIQAFADDAEFSGDDEHDIIDETATERSTDDIITLQDYSGSGGVTFNIDDTAAEHLYDGSIIQDGGDTIYDGIVNFGNATVQIQILQCGAILSDDWWNKGGTEGAHDGADNASVLTDSGESWTVDEWIGYTIYNTTDGSQGLITDNDGTTITAILYGGTDDDWDIGDNYVIGVPLNSDATSGISHRFMIKVRADGVDIGRRKLVGTCRRFNNTFSEFTINSTSRGNNVLALADGDDLNNDTSPLTVETWTTITNTEGLRLLDLDNDGSDEEYYSEWDRGAYTINQFYERMKWLVMDGSSSTIQGQNGELMRGITHYFAYDGETGTMFTTNEEGCWGEELIFNNGSGSPAFQIGEAIHEDTATPAWKGRVMGGDLSSASGSLIVDLESGTLTNLDGFTGQDSGATADVNDGTPPSTPTATAGRMRFYAIDDDGTDGNLYGQIMCGTAPVNNTRIYDDADSTNYVDVAGSVTTPDISTPFVGQSTGSALIGGHGFALEYADVSSSDTFFDLQGNAITPPNQVTFTVSGLVSGEDYVLVTNDDSTGIDFTQMATDTTYNSSGITSISINPSPGIPSDTPTTAGTTGSIRIERNDGLYSQHRYTALDLATDTFTIPSHDFTSNPATSPKNVFIGYLDVLATSSDMTFQYVYASDRTHFIRVRDGGGTPIKTAETTGVMGTNGGSVTANRISDA